MPSRTTVKLLLGLVLGVPILQAVLYWVGGLFAAMGDAATAEVLGHVNTAAHISWLVSIVGLVVMLAVNALQQPHDLES
ncbi:MAG: hypothetical protein KDA57_02025 [Planctomycetales bacterium]|nr:hypothetical protein [Planctomycetales bacterium]